jgi:hypothetical protein
MCEIAQERHQERRAAWVSVPRISRTVLSPLVLACLLLGCTQLGPAPQTVRKVAVLDLETPANFGNPPNEIKGWWFGSHNLFRNPRAGAMFADTLAQTLLTLKYVETYPRLAGNAYFAKKRKLLKERFPGRTDAEYDLMLRKAPPADYGAELGVDEVLAGGIVDAYMSYHRTFASWHSYVEVRLELWDVKTRRVLWNGVFKSRRIYLSQESTMREMAPDVVEALEKDYYRRPQ